MGKDSEAQEVTQTALDLTAKRVGIGTRFLLTAKSCSLLHPSALSSVLESDMELSPLPVPLAWV